MLFLRGHGQVQTLGRSTRTGTHVTSHCKTEFAFTTWSSHEMLLNVTEDDVVFDAKYLMLPFIHVLLNSISLSSHSNLICERKSNYYCY
eukprot:scaffold5064_cov121-Cylindrotheca_fusiformis.AAC.3